MGYGEHYRVRSPRGRFFYSRIDDALRRREAGRDDGCRIGNRLLELLDGTSQTDGVVVIGATNNPDRIDKALLRSGRLEKHIVIPKPDTEALIGILRHHLKDELDAVIASAPKQEAGPPDVAADAGTKVDATAADGPDAIASHRNPPAE